MRLHALGERGDFLCRQGNSQRPYERANRTPRWHAHVEKSGGYEINIHTWTNDRVEAEQIESEMIAAYGPCCNTLLIDRRAYSDRVQANVRFEADVLAALQKIAAREERTISFMINRIIKDYLKAKKVLK
jgi:hypothetical protein